MHSQVAVKSSFLSQDLAQFLQLVPQQNGNGAMVFTDGYHTSWPLTLSKPPNALTFKIPARTLMDSAVQRLYHDKES